MGYLAEKQKERMEYETYPIVKVKDIEATPFRIIDVHIADIAGQFGNQHTAVCTITFGDKEEKNTVFISKAIVVRTLEDGIKDGHDWNDGVFYVLENVDKKSGNGSYWNIREA